GVDTTCAPRGRVGRTAATTALNRIGAYLPQPSGVGRHAPFPWMCFTRRGGLQQVAWAPSRQAVINAMPLPACPFAGSEPCSPAAADWSVVADAIVTADCEECTVSMLW